LAKCQFLFLEPTKGRTFCWIFCRRIGRGLGCSISGCCCPAAFPDGFLLLNQNNLSVSIFRYLYGVPLSVLPVGFLFLTPSSYAGFFDCGDSSEEPYVDLWLFFSFPFLIFLCPHEIAHFFLFFFSPRLYVPEEGLWLPPLTPFGQDYVSFQLQGVIVSPPGTLGLINPFPLFIRCCFEPL